MLLHTLLTFKFEISSVVKTSLSVRKVLDRFPGQSNRTQFRQRLANRCDVPSEFCVAQPLIRGDGPATRYTRSVILRIY